MFSRYADLRYRATQAIRQHKPGSKLAAELLNALNNTEHALRAYEQLAAPTPIDLGNHPPYYPTGDVSPARLTGGAI